MADVRIKDLLNEALNFEDDHFAELDGAATGGKKMRLGRVLNALRNALAPRQGLRFGGAAQATVTLPTFGTSDFTLVFWVTPKDFSVDQYLVGPNVVNAFYSGLRSGAGTVFSGFGGAATFTDTGMTLVAGKPACLVRVRSNGTFQWYLNGVARDSGADANNYSVANSTFAGSGAAHLNGFLAPFVYNRALSAAEVLSLYESGAPAAGDYNPQSGAYTSDFSVGVDGWGNGANTVVAGNVDGINAENDVLRCYADATNAGHALVRILTMFSVGKLFRVTGRIYVPTGQTNLTTVNIMLGGQPSGAGRWTRLSGAEVFTPNAAWQNVDMVIRIDDSAAQTGYVYMNNAAAFSGANSPTNDVFYLKSVVVTPLGLLCAPESNAPGNGLLWTDQSGNGAHIVLPTSGVAWNLPSTAVNKVRGTTNTLGNQQLLAATVLPALCQITRIRARSRTGAPTVTLGTASGGAQLVASVALSTTWKDLTIALTGGIVTATSSVWVGSNSTDVVEIDITHEPLGF